MPAQATLSPGGAGVDRGPLAGAMSPFGGRGTAVEPRAVLKAKGAGGGVDVAPEVCDGFDALVTKYAKSILIIIILGKTFGT